jgi:arabinofuranan 3-O-arabinosyltransferase
LQYRLRLAAVCLAFLGLTLAQQPGRILSDTKLDLAVDPWGFLGRALRLWEPEGFAGQVQNQAYGYLFPMGPFFGIGQSLGVPVWILQRVWLALLLSLAFLGVVTLARQLRIGSPYARLLGGLVYALAPRMLGGLGSISVEVLPMALAPWVLVPLVAGARGGSPRRAAALSGLAVLCVGGVNAVATAAVLPLAALWLLTRPAGPRRRRLIGWWTAAVALATAWWVAPLLLLGRYSPPFLDYIETARTTTAPTDLLSTLRGVSHWVAHLAAPEGPLWPTGWALVHETLPVLATLTLAIAGLLGLLRADLPERCWLILGLVTGLVLVTAGHLGVVQGVLAEPLHAALDGVLAPLRNLHKFDPVLRLSLALGVTHLTGLLLARAQRADAGRPRRSGRLARSAAAVAAAAVVLALLATVSPAVAGRLAPPTGFESIPGYWRQVADWLAAAEPSGRALLLPASRFGTYTWGTTSDEPLQPLARSPWEVRDAIPLTPPGHIRMLDAVEERLARGEGSAGLARFLARAGISHLVVRHDLDFGAADAVRPALFLRALADSPGITPVAGFGPVVPGAQGFPGTALDYFLTPQRQAVEIYAVADPAPHAYTVPLSDVVTVAGGPEGVLALEERGLIGDRPVLLADGTKAGAGTGATFVADAQVRRERDFGRLDNATSAGLTADDPLRLRGPARDYLYPGAEFNESVVSVEGARVSAASSASDAGSFGGAIPAAQPFAALDGDVGTAWRPADRLGEEQPVWWRVRSDRLLTARSITVQLPAQPHGPPARVLVRTDRGERPVRLEATTQPQAIALPPGPTQLIEIRAEGPDAARLALAEVDIPGLQATRTVVPPAFGAAPGGIAGYAFDASNPAAAGCLRTGILAVRCAPVLVRQPEESTGLHRVLAVPEPAGYDVEVIARPRPGPELDALIASVARPVGPTITVSSTAVPDPRGGADAVTDGVASTTWVAAPDDRRPSLTLEWLSPQRIDRLRVVTAPGIAATVPLALTLGIDGLERTVWLDADGTARFDPVTTARLTLTFPVLNELDSFDPHSRLTTPVGVGISELQINGLSSAAPATAVELPCGAGPVVEVDGRRIDTAVHTTLRGLRSLEPVPLQLCGESITGEFAVGVHRFAVHGTDTFAATSATLLRPEVGAVAGSGARDSGVRDDVRITSWAAERRTLEVPARAAATLLVVPENVNPGWVATLDGRELEPRTVDGWQQGYLLPAGAAGEVLLEFVPGPAYRAALVAGAAAVLLLIGLLMLPARRSLPPPLGTRRRSGPVVVLAVLAGAALFGGEVGLVAIAAAFGIGWAAGPRRRLVLGTLITAGVLAAGILALAGDSSDTAEVAVQTSALVGVAALLASVLPGREAVPAGRSGTRRRRRRSGRSTASYTTAARPTETNQTPTNTSQVLPVNGTQPNAEYAPASTTMWTRKSP